MVQNTGPVQSIAAGEPTPGPWKLRRSMRLPAERYVWSIEPAKFNPRTDYPIAQGIASEADANLFMAVRDLLFAAKVAEDVLSLQSDSCALAPSPDVRCGQCLGCALHGSKDLLRTAIAKAEGRTNA